MASFVDTNILIYAIIADEHEATDKVNVARTLVTDLVRRREMILSAQVLSEFSSNATRKGSPPPTVEQIVERVLELSKETVVPVDHTLVLLALQRVQQSRISYWDAPIVEAAIRSGSTILYTDVTHNGTRYGGVEIRHPFVA